MAESKKAVFLSYASQDAEVAQHIANSLRSAGVEVWFDQSELRGGDVWDQTIRRHIRDCELFCRSSLPIRRRGRRGTSGSSGDLRSSVHI